MAKGLCLAGRRGVRRKSKVNSGLRRDGRNELPCWVSACIDGCLECVSAGESSGMAWAGILCELVFEANTKRGECLA